MGGEPSKPQISVNEALEILVRHVTEEIGFAPRDVYSAILHLPQMKEKRDLAVEQLTYHKLLTFVRTFSKDCRLDSFSHDVIAVHPHKISDGEDKWEIHFKSTQTMKAAESLMEAEEDIHIRETYGLLRNIPEGSVLAGWLFEKIARSILIKVWVGTAPRVTPMTSENGVPPVFSTDSPSRSSPLELRLRTVQKVEFAPGTDLPAVTLDGDKLYIPTATNDPPFDSFTIYHDPNNDTVIISIYRMTIAESQRGSARGYTRIDKIVSRVCSLLQASSDPKVEVKNRVKVKYFLVCPADGVQREWTMPSGWDDNTAQNDYRGDVFCIRVPGL